MENPQEIIVKLCKQFYQLGWVSGTGGGMSIRDSSKVYIAPSGVAKENMRPEDIFILDYENNLRPIYCPQNENYKISACTPLFMKIYSLRPSTRAVIHSHSMNAVLASMTHNAYNQIAVTQLEMIKGIRRGESGINYSNEDILIIPIIENTAEEADLVEDLEAAILKYPDTNAVVVRHHGIYLWGENWETAKTMAECYDYILECYLRCAAIGRDLSVPFYYVNNSRARR